MLLLLVLVVLIVVGIYMLLLLRLLLLLLLLRLLRRLLLLRRPLLCWQGGLRLCFLHCRKVWQQFGQRHDFWSAEPLWLPCKLQCSVQQAFQVASMQLHPYKKQDVVQNLMCAACSDLCR